MYCEIIDNKIIHPSNFEGSRYFSIDYNDYISRPDYYIYDEETDDIIINKNYDQEQLEKAKIAKQEEATEKAYIYEKVGVFPYTAEDVITGEQIEVHIEFNVDNLSKFQGKLKGFETGRYPSGKTTWLSQEDKPIYITEEDCIKILEKIEIYDSYLWENQYVYYLIEISNATTIEEVENIIISYEQLQQPQLGD